MEKKWVRLILVMHFIKPTISELLSYHHVIDTKINELSDTLCFWTKPVKSDVWFAHTAHVMSDQPHFKGTVAMCGPHSQREPPRPSACTGFSLDGLGLGGAV